MERSTFERDGNKHVGPNLKSGLIHSNPIPVTIIDLLRRTGIEVTALYLKKNPVTGSHGLADKNIDEICPAESYLSGAAIRPAPYREKTRVKN